MSPGPPLLTTPSIPQQQQQPQSNMPTKSTMQQVYHYDNTGQQPVEADQHNNSELQNCSNTNTLSTPNSTLANIKEKTPMCLVNELGIYFLSVFDC